MALIIADTRESNGANSYFPSILEKNNKQYQPSIELEIAQITKGDYSIFLGNKLYMVIERKTWKDLSASIKDNRIDTQLENLINLKKQFVKILLIIEGNFNKQDDVNVSGIPFKNLHAKLRHIYILHDIGFMQTKDQEHTAKLVVKLARDGLNILKLMPDFLKSEILKESNILTTRTEKKDSDIIFNIWNCLKGSGAKTSIVLSEKYHISELILGKLTDLQDISIGNKKIGNKSKIILESINDKKTIVKILACIPGISDKTAEKILEKFTINQICTNLSIDELSEIKINNRRINKNSVQKIIEIFQIKNK